MEIQADPITRYLSDAAKVALEFSQSMFTLVVSTRALQRQGLDVTLRETFLEIKELRKEFGIFSQTEMVSGVANIQLLTRNFGYSIEQIKQMTRATAQLSILTGKDFNESARALALFLASGYSESLQRAGLNVNKARIEHEALLLGIRKAYVDMSGEEKAAAGLIAVMKELAGVSEDVSAIQDELAGKSRKADAAFADLKRTVGELLTPAFVMFKGALAGAARFFTRLLSEVLPKAGAVAAKALVPLIVHVQALWKLLSDPTAAMSFDEITREIERQMRGIDEQLQKILETGSLIPSKLGDVEIGTGLFDSAEEEAAKNEDIFENLKNKISRIFNNINLFFFQ